MAQNFIGCDRDQVLLLPPDLRDWLPDGHLARFVIETVEQLDLSAIYGYYRQDGHGRPAHDPAMMTSLVLYAYSVGMTSSRQIARRCVEDVAFRVIAANQQPDHSTISRFLVRHRVELSELFFDVLALCQRAGMVKVGTVAVDSTKIAANASLSENRTAAGLRAEAERLIEEAIQTDQAEDALYGQASGDELPEELADPRTRKGRIKELLEQARAEREKIESDRENARVQTQARRDEHLARTGKKLRVRGAKAELSKKEQALVEQKKYNLTDPDSRIVKHRGMLMQGYSVQTVVSDDQIVLSAQASDSAVDQGQLLSAVQRSREHLERLGAADPVLNVVADSGYYNIAQIQTLAQDGTRVLVPPVQGNALSPQRLSAASHRMLTELHTPTGKTVYGRRQAIVEPVFAQIKHNRKITRLFRRGRTAVQAEIDLIFTTHNLLRLFHTHPAV